jgi:HEPN domain-containing protein
VKTSDIVKRADELIGMGQQVLTTRRRSEYSDAVDAAPMKAFRVAVLSFIDRVYGRAHPHFSEFHGCTDNNYFSNAENGLAVIRAIRDEIAGGWLFTVKGLVTAEVFADFLEMADHLLEAGYKDPAAVMAGSVLEEHLRQLCVKNNIAIYETKNGKQVALKADRLNADLAGATVYSKLEQKQITAWLDLRNNAAHGKYNQYDTSQVSALVLGVTDFMVRVPT